MELARAEFPALYWAAMWSRPLFSAFVWLTLLLPLTATAQAPSDNNAPQTPNSTNGIPTFYAHARQVIIAVDVWDKTLKKGESPWIGDEPLDTGEKNHLRQLPPPARGLTAKDFHVFDNGAEQSINYLKEADFPAVDLTKQWVFWPTAFGTWGHLQPNYSVEPSSAKYLIGYVPASIQPGECRNVKVAVEGRITKTNRSEYCYSPHNDIDQIAGTKLGDKMRDFASSSARGSFRMSVRTFTFWSSGVLGLTTESAGGETATTSGNGFTYVVEVHDSMAPATVQMSVGFDFPDSVWYFPCRERDAIYVLGIVKETNGQPVGQFADAYSCLHTLMSNPASYKISSGVLVPSRFDTQLDLTPGSYTVSVVVSDRHHFGRVQTPLRVGSLDPQRLLISDLVVANVLRGVGWVLRDATSVSPSPVTPTPLVSKDLQYIPDVVNPSRLPKHAPLYLYFEVYQPTSDTQAAGVFYQLRITDLKTGSLVMNTGPVSAADWIVPGNLVIPIGLKVATEKLHKGSYRLEIQATDSAGRQTEWRQTDFAVQ
jgi:hypothetical protein